MHAAGSGLPDLDILDGVELIPLHVHLRVENQGIHGAGEIDTAETGSPKQQVKRLQAGVRPEPQPLQLQMQGTA